MLSALSGTNVRQTIAQVMNFGLVLGTVRSPVIQNLPQRANTCPRPS